MNLLANTPIVMLLIGACVFGVAFLWMDRILEILLKRSLGQREYVIQKLESMFVEVDRPRMTKMLLLLSFGLGAVVFIATWPNVLAGMLMGGLVTFLMWQVPKPVVDILVDRRRKEFTNQMTDAMTIMANGVSSGLSVPQSMERIAQNMKNPISQEFNLVLSQIRIGLSVEEALNGLGERIPEPEVQMFVTSVNILKETGGNLTETFVTIAETIRERQKIQKKIEAMTAQGITQGIIVSMVPFIMLAVFLVVDPGYVKPLFTTTLGWICILLIIVLEVIGGLAIRKIVTIKV
jgi:tight adherence protein B